MNLPASEKVTDSRGQGAAWAAAVSRTGTQAELRPGEEMGCEPDAYQRRRGPQHGGQDAREEMAIQVDVSSLETARLFPRGGRLARKWP